MDIQEIDLSSIQTGILLVNTRSSLYVLEILGDYVEVSGGRFFTEPKLVRLEGLSLSGMSWLKLNKIEVGYCMEFNDEGHMTKTSSVTRIRLIQPTVHN